MSFPSIFLLLLQYEIAVFCSAFGVISTFHTRSLLHTSPQSSLWPVVRVSRSVVRLYKLLCQNCRVKSTHRPRKLIIIFKICFFFFLYEMDDVHCRAKILGEFLHVCCLKRHLVFKFFFAQLNRFLVIRTGFGSLYFRMLAAFLWV